MKIIILFFTAFLAGLAAFYSTVTMKQHADLLILNATVYTVDAKNSVADAIAIRGDRILSVGATQDIEKHFSSQNIIDAKGKTVIPGLIDAHAHVLGLGISLKELNLLGTTSKEEIAAIVGERVKKSKPGEWIRGRGWDQNDWGTGIGEKPFPTAAALDKVSPNNPVVLSRIDGHAIWVNSKAMELAGIKNNSALEIAGGKIIRDAKKNPTGIFIDNAEEVITKIIPEYSSEEKKELYNLAFTECLKVGLTGVHDMGIDKSDFEIYKTLSDKQELPVRIYAAVGGNNSLWNELKKTGIYLDSKNHLFNVRAIKLYADGALGSRGAAMIEPYSDEPDNRGLELTSKHDLQKLTDDAVHNGFQVCTHAIGDKGNRNVLDVYESAIKKYPAAKDLRLRVEHAQVIEHSDFVRFKKLNVIPSMQPTHCTSDMYWAQARLGPKRILGAYAWRALLDEGVIIPSGSDFPVELPNPLYGFYAAVTRQDKNGIPNSAADVRAMFQLSADGIKDTSYFNNGWYGEQKMSREEALRSFTQWAAYAEFSEHLKGSIEAGKLADVVVLSKDIMKIPAKEILAAEIEITIVGGKIRRQNSPR